MSLRDNQIHGQNHVVQGQSSQANTLNIARYRKAVYSALWVQVTLVICYLPYSIAVAFRTRQGGRGGCLYLLTLLGNLQLLLIVFLNSSLNPFLYRSETSCKRNITTTLLYQLRLGLRLMALRLPVVKSPPESIVLACQRNIY